MRCCRPLEDSPGEHSLKWVVLVLRKASFQQWRDVSDIKAGDLAKFGGRHLML